MQSIDIFQDLSPAEMQEMDRTTTMSTCRRGKVFFRPADESEVLFILKKGRVQLYRITVDGKKLVTDTIGAGTIFGEMALVGQGMHNTYAEAVEDCLLCVMSRHDVERLIVNKPAVSLRVMQVMAGRLRRAEAQLEEIAFKSVPIRLATVLLRLRDEVGDRITGYSHQDLADALGAYRETVTLALNQFRENGLVEIGRKRIDVVDARGLAEVATG